MRDEKRLKVIWNGMKNRCYKPEHTTYKYYGGKGVIICKEWLCSSQTFIQWALNNGYDSLLTLDRADSNGNYEPSNCSWKTRKEQQANRHDNRRFSFNGEMLTAGEISAITGGNYYAEYNKRYKQLKNSDKWIK